MCQNTNEILAENARRCAILRNASRPPRPLHRRHSRRQCSCRDSHGMLIHRIYA